MIKFNGGAGALVCDNCRVIIKEPYSPKDKKDALCERCENAFKTLKKNLKKAKKNKDMDGQSYWEQLIKTKPPKVKKIDNKKALIEQSMDEDLIVYDGCDDAIIGWGGRCGMPNVTIYDWDLLVKCFMKQGMDYDEAIEWIDFNILGGYIGERTPIVINKLEK